MAHEAMYAWKEEDNNRVTRQCSTTSKEMMRNTSVTRFETSQVSERAKEDDMVLSIGGIFWGV